MVVVTERVTLEIIRGWHKTLWKPQRDLLFKGWLRIITFLRRKYFQHMGMLVWPLQSV